MDPTKQKIILAGERAFQDGLAKARARGGPVREIDSLCASGGEAPTLISGERLSRMTLGIQRLLQKRAAMPDDMDPAEILLFFARGPRVATLFDAYDEEEQQWTDPSARHAYEGMAAETEALADDALIQAVNDWLSRELQTFNRLASEGSGAKSKSAGAGADGSRVGWWLRAVEGVCAHYAAACPPGQDLTQWAIWSFPLNDYLALQPAAHERAGHELPEHYAVAEARKARSRAKAECKMQNEKTGTIPSTASVRVCGIDCHPGDENCNGYCTGKAPRPANFADDSVAR